MEITEEKLYEVFGVSPDKGEKESEAAEQTEDRDTSSVADATPSPQGEGNEAGDTVPEEAGEESGEEDSESGDAETEEAEEPDGTQSPEQRKQNAARRRQQERQAAIDAAVQAALQERDDRYAQEQEEFFRKAGLINPFTKEPITNMEEFNAWRSEQDNQKLQKELQSGKLTKETLNELIDQHPAVQAARQAQAQEQAAEEARKDQVFQQEVERQLQEIRKTDPEIKTVADLMNRPYSKEFYEAVQRGNNFLDAFYLATRGQAQEQAAAAARQSAVNNLTGKSHLRATSIGGRPGATVTADEREMYHLFNPKATDAEIQRYQNKFKKS